MMEAAAAVRGALRGIRGLGGAWVYLTERVRARTAVELERERNKASVDLVTQVKDGMDFFESEPGGRTRVIRRTSSPAPLEPSRQSPTAGEITS